MITHLLHKEYSRYIYFEVILTRDMHIFEDNIKAKKDASMGPYLERTTRGPRGGLRIFSIVVQLSP